MDLLGVKRETKEAIEYLTEMMRKLDASRGKADVVLDNLVATTADVRAITSMLRAALVKDHP